MRILNEDDDKALKKIILYLTKEEAQELKTSLVDILEKKHHHSHVSSENSKKEVSLCVYDVNNLAFFDDRSKKLILEDL